MKIGDSKNLKYDKVPWIESIEDREKSDPSNCILISFSRTNDKLTLHFKNEGRAVIKSKNIEGGREINLIEEKINNFLEKSYEEILNTNF